MLDFYLSEGEHSSDEIDPCNRRRFSPHTTCKQHCALIYRAFTKLFKEEKEITFKSIRLLCTI